MLRRQGADAQPTAAPSGFWDCHCHVLPGLDDGPADPTASLAMLRLAAANGTDHVIATPHAVDGLYPTHRDQVLAVLAEMRARCAAEGIAIELLAGQEVALVPDLPERLQRGEVLTLGDAGRAVLVELPPLALPPYWDRTFFRLQLLGVTPVVAHAERTPLLTDDRLTRRVVALGGRLQVNAAALRDRTVRRTLERWLRSGWVACLGSDGHDLQRRPPVLAPAGAAWLAACRARPAFLAPMRA